eukprot:g414.t1
MLGRPIGRSARLRSAAAVLVLSCCMAAVDGSVCQVRTFHGVSSSKNWYDARDHCKASYENGDLAAIRNQGDLDAVRAVYGGHLWIGIEDHRIEGTWRNVDGTAPLLRWAAGEPNNSGNEDCVHLRSGANTYNDNGCSSARLYFACQACFCGAGRTITAASTRRNPSESARSYSSIWDNNAKGTGHAASRLDSNQGWSSRHNSVDSWLRLDLGTQEAVGGIVTQKRKCGNECQYVKTVRVEVSNDDHLWQYVDGGKTYNANYVGQDQNAKTEISFDRTYSARYVRIRVRTWHRHISMRAGVLVATCQPCPAGKYKDSVDNRACSDCPHGRYGDQAERTAASQCKSCGAGKYQDQVARAAESQCKSCGTGRYHQQVARTAESQCKSCPAGKYQAQAVAPSCLQCGQIGRYSAAGAAGCSTCPAGSFTSGINEAERVACTTCPPGHKCVGDARMHRCAAGQYQAAAGRNVCAQCAAGRFGVLQTNFIVHDETGGASSAGWYAVQNPSESARSYSSIYGNNAKGTGHAASRLDSNQGWSSRHNSVDSWLRLDLGVTQSVGGIVTQKRKCGNECQYVKTVRVEVSADGSSWQYVDGGKTFSANYVGQDQNARTTINFGATYSARHVRIRVRTWHRHISMRAGVLVADGLLGRVGQGRSQYSGYTMHGPWGSELHSVERTFALRPCATTCAVSWTSYGMHTRDNEVDRAYVNGNEVWRRSMLGSAKYDGVWAGGCSGTITVKWTSDTNQHVNDESWGFGNVKIVEIFGCEGELGTTVQDACQACAVGLWQDQTGQASCKSQNTCPNGQWLDGESSTNAGACKVCPAGKYKNSGVNRNGCSPQTTCPNGQWLDGEGASSPGTCKACPLGRYKSSGADRGDCADCVAGFYQDQSGQGGCKALSTCPTGEWLDGESVTASGKCKTCPSGKYRVATCPPSRAELESVVRAAGGHGVLVGEEFQPEVQYNGEWYPICGHYFWDDNIGATTVCQALGFPAGTMRRTRATFTKDSMPVGRCRAGEALDSCTFGGNAWGNFAYHGGWCRAGHGIGVAVKCTGAQGALRGPSAPNLRAVDRTVKRAAESSYCDADGWELAMRFGTSSAFTFGSEHWTTASTLNFVVHEEGAASSAGWGSGAHARVGRGRSHYSAYTMHGPWGSELRSVERSFALRPCASQCAVSWTSYGMHTRDSEYDRVYVNGNEVWSKRMSGSAKYDGVWAGGCSGTITVKWTSDTNQHVNDESWGFGNVKIVEIFGCDSEDAKLANFNNIAATKIKGCLPDGCVEYTLPAVQTLLTLFHDTPVSSSTNIKFAEGASMGSEAYKWCDIAGTRSICNGFRYYGVGINFDDDRSGYDSRVRFGLLTNNEQDIRTNNNALGFGASSYGDGSGPANQNWKISESKWSVGSGVAHGSSLDRMKGTIWIKVGDNANDDCSDQNTCPNGQWLDGESSTNAGACKVCPAGKYKNSGVNRNDCSPQTTCPNGQWVDGESTTSAGTCKPCPDGKYKTGTDRNGCSDQNACPNGQWLADVQYNRANIYSRYSRIQCYGSWAEIANRPAGGSARDDNPFYKSYGTLALANCKAACDSDSACAAFEFADGGHATSSARRCHAFFACSNTAHHWSGGTSYVKVVPTDSAMAAGACKACPSGKYKNSGTNRNGCSDQRVCPNGQWLDGESATNAGTCKACPAGMYKNSGINRNGCSHQKTCPNGQWLDGESATSAGTCKGCPGGKYKNSGVNRNGCSPQKTCPNGQWLDGESTTSAGACKGCPGGKFKNSGTNRNDCSNQNTCPSGQWLDGESSTSAGVCRDCPSGKFKNSGDDRNDCSNWALCQNGKGLNSESATNRGTCTDCLAGRYYGWSSKSNPAGSWMQLDLGGARAVGGIVVQKRLCGNECQYVKSVKVTVSRDNSEWASVDGGKEFNANYAGQSQNARQQIVFSSVVSARYVRIEARDYKGHISMRAGVLVQVSPCIAQTTCPSGQWLDGESSTSAGACKVCPAGKYKNSGVNRNDCSDQNTCPNGQWLDGESSTSAGTCKGCPGGKFKSSGIDRSDCADQNVCPNGQWLDGESSTSAGTCKGCPGGKFKNSGTNRNDCSGQNTCPSGQWLDSESSTSAGTCKGCPGGKFKSSGIDRSDCADQNTCPSGQWLDGESSTSAGTCKGCPDGKYKSSGADRKDCSAQRTCSDGHYSLSRDASAYGSCAACPGGKWKAGSNYAGCSTQNSCPNGKWLHGESSATAGTCKACPGGKFKNSGTDRKDCSNQKACPNGKWLDGESAASAGACKVCPGGKYKSSGADRNDCSPQETCPSGQWLDGESSTSAGACKGCPRGKYKNSGVNRNDCSDQNTCPNGQWLDGESSTSAGTCKGCPGGKFKSSGINRSDCADQNVCPNAGQYQSFTGGASCSICSQVDKYQEQAGQGQYSVKGSTSCTDCAAGQYQQYIAGETCDICSQADAYQDEAGQVSCKTCDAGHYRGSASSCIECPPGYRCDGQAKAGTGGDQSLESYCEDCVAGQYSVKGSTSCTDCAAGQYQQYIAGETCDICSQADAYQDEAGQVSCKTCDAGHYRGSASSCIECPPGYRCDGQAKYPCSPGEYAAESRQQTCRSCDTGQYQAREGMAACDACDAGKKGSGDDQTVDTYCMDCERRLGNVRRVQCG